MTIWIDADACPKVLKEVLYRTATRLQCQLILVAHSPLSAPASAWIRTVQVERGFDAADRYIAERATEGDLVITNDIPLAADVIANGAGVINSRGEVLDRENIGERLRVRNLMEERRALGEFGGGPPPLDNRDKAQFANALDRWLARHPQRG